MGQCPSSWSTSGIAFPGCMRPWLHNDCLIHAQRGKSVILSSIKCLFKMFEFIFTVNLNAELHADVIFCKRGVIIYTIKNISIAITLQLLHSNDKARQGTDYTQTTISNKLI